MLRQAQHERGWRRAARVAALVLALAGTGCVRTVVGVATAPVRAAGWTADKLTTSQSEADRNAGRKMRKQREREAKEERKRDKAQREQWDEQKDGGG